MDETFIKVSSEDADFINVFLPKLATKLPKHTEINNHIIELVDNWPLQYGSIYSLRPVELETLKIYIKNNPTNSFIRPSKSFAKALIFFYKKPDRSLKLCVDYQGLNSLIIKN